MLIDPRSMGLVLEGGGMRGVFTSGVLDAFMKHGLYFDYIVAVSAGACNGMSYASRQPRRARISNIDFLARYHYVGLRHLLTQGCIFDRKLLYDAFPNELIPFDFDTYFQHSANFEMVTTNCLTGRAMYLTEDHDRQRALDIVMASSSLPYVSKMVTVDGIPMLDGGIVDSIPLRRAQERGYDLDLKLRNATVKSFTDAFSRQTGVAFSFGSELAGKELGDIEVQASSKSLESLSRIHI